MSQDLASILEAARQLAPEEQRRLAEQLLKEIDKIDDPILQLGKDPVTEDVTDASVNHDRYIYRA